MPKPISLRLPFHRRFPVRVTLLFAVPVYTILILLAIGAYQRWLATEMGALRGRLHSIVVALSQQIPTKVAEPGWNKADVASLTSTFERIAEGEADLASIYVLLPNEDPKAWRFVSDWTRKGGDEAEIGQIYDAGQARKLIPAYERASPQVEDQIYSDEWGPTLSGYAPIFRDDEVIAVVGADVTGAQVDAIWGQVVQKTGIVFSVTFMSIALVGLVVSRNVRIPLEQMVRFTNRIASGELTARLDLDRKDEFGLLGVHLDRMARGLQEREHIRGMFSRYMSETVAKKVLSSPEGYVRAAEHEVTVLFSDIQSYSTIAEHLSPIQVVEMLNEYMGAMCHVVDAHDGIVIEFLGDAILAVFGAPESLDDHGSRAVRCARAMNRRLIELNRDWEASGLADLWKSSGVKHLKARIGVHSGVVVAGNMGGPTRMKYAVVGDAVNVASRIENLNTQLGTRILVTKTTYMTLDDALKSEATAKGEHLLKGRETPVAVYTFDPELT